MYASVSQPFFSSRYTNQSKQNAENATPEWSKATQKISPFFVGPNL